MHEPSYGAVRLSFWLWEIARFARRYSPAMDALNERRSAAESRILDGSAKYEDISVYTRINQWLENETATLSLYDQVKREGKLSAIAMIGFEEAVFRLLVDSRQYERAMPNVPGRVARDFETYEATLGTFADWGLLLTDDALRMQFEELEKTAGPTFREDMRRSAEDSLRRGVASSYQVLLGARRDEEAVRVAERLINALDDAETRKTLAWAGYLTGSPSEANLTQAREAFAMTSGQNIAIVATFARVLASIGHRDEAIAVAQAGLDKAATTLERHIMSECLQYCQQSPQMVVSPTRCR